jgi:ribosomal protein L11 methyltransferase
MIRLALRVRREDAEVALAELLELAPQGVEERDLGELVEYAVYGAPGELPALPDLRAAAGEALVEVSTQEIADDWHERWRDFHRPVDVGPAKRAHPPHPRGPRLHVRPPWTGSPGPAHPPDRVLELVIDPGQAFGTGAHATTRLCLELLLELEPGGALIDLGCGSGVLAIAAARLGWRPVAGIDHERESVQATLDNAAVNGVDVLARRHDLVHDGPAPSAPTVVANLLRPLLLRLADDGLAGDPPQAIIAGGLLREQADEVSAALTARFGLREAQRRHTGQWAALLLLPP